MQPDTIWVGIDHVQLAMPVGGEEVAREFYVRVLGLAEVTKPRALAARGGCWFESGSVRLHLGVEDGFRPARKAHPALLVRGLREVVTLAGLDAAWSDDIPGVERCFIADPFGNCIDLIDAAAGDDR
jgi:catechol 2,3-dioxygenase-like lactoylglutathione lyase family enzyme